MPVLITSAELMAQIEKEPDTLASTWLPEGSFAKAAYMEKSIVQLRSPHGPADADKAECEKWDLTPEQWSQQMEIALIATRHDARLDLIEQGITPSM